MQGLRNAAHRAAVLRLCVSSIGYNKKNFRKLIVCNFRYKQPLSRAVTYVVCSIHQPQIQEERSRH